MLIYILIRIMLIKRVIIKLMLITRVIIALLKEMLILPIISLMIIIKIIMLMLKMVSKLSEHNMSVDAMAKSLLHARCPCC